MSAPARRHQASRRWVFVAAGVVALVVLLIGGYGAHWAWTGFSDNDTLWDWLQLLLLPIIIAGLPFWLAHGDFMDRRVRVFAVGVVVAFVALVVVGYVIPWNWTGFPGNKLWDWLGLILLPFVVASIRLWPEIRRRFAPRHAVAFTALVSGLVALVLVGYLRPWTWTGFTGNTLWDWIQLLAVPLLVPTVVVPVAVGYMAAGVEERELEAGVKTVEPEPHPARAPRPAPARAAIVAASAGVALLVGGVVGALAFGSGGGTSTSSTAAPPTTAAAASAPCAGSAGTTLIGDGDGRVVRVGQTYYACPTGHKPIVLCQRAQGLGAGPLRAVSVAGGVRQRELHGRPVDVRDTGQGRPGLGRACLQPADRARRACVGAGADTRRRHRAHAARPAQAGAHPGRPDAHRRAGLGSRCHLARPRRRHRVLAHERPDGLGPARERCERLASAP